LLDTSLAVALSFREPTNDRTDFKSPGSRISA